MKTNHIITTCLLGLSLGLTSCDSPMEEIKDIIFDRVFSPIGLEAKNIGESNATLNWTASSGVKSYQVEVYADDSLTFTGSPIAASHSLFARRHWRQGHRCTLACRRRC